MEIIILGTGCSKCKTLFETTQKAVEELNIDATLTKEEDLMRIMEYNVMRTPAIVINGKVIGSGKSYNLTELKTLLTLNNK